MGELQQFSKDWPRAKRLSSTPSISGGAERRCMLLL